MTDEVIDAVTGAEVVPFDSGERGIQLVLDLESSGAMTPTSLTLPPELKFSTYSSVGSLLGRIKRASSWWVGDWLNFGEGLYGEKFAQAAAETGLSEDTLQHYGYVARSVPPSRRIANLAFSIHAVVAPMNPAQQKKWLGRADKHGWTREDLIAAIKAEQDAASPPLDEGMGEPAQSELHEICAAILRDAQRDLDPGFWRVPDETIVRLRAAMGREED